MSFSEQQKNEIRQIIDEQLEKFLRYQLRAFQPPELAPVPDRKFTALSPEQLTDLEVSLHGDTWHIKPLKHLDTPLFAKICKQIEDAGGKYVKEPNYHHWEVKA